jgi:hypothetical protein
MALSVILVRVYKTGRQARKRKAVEMWLRIGKDIWKLAVSTVLGIALALERE